MTIPSVNCTHCGKNMTTDDLRGVTCRYCGTVLPHHARAAQQVAVVQQMMADRNGNGIPDAFEPLVMNANAHAMNQAFGFGAPQPPPHYGPYGMGANMAPPPYVHVAQANAFMYPNAMAPRRSGASTAFLVIALVGAVLGMMAAGVAVMFVAS